MDALKRWQEAMLARIENMPSHRRVKYRHGWRRWFMQAILCRHFCVDCEGWYPLRHFES